MKKIIFILMMFMMIVSFDSVLAECNPATLDSNILLHYNLRGNTFTEDVHNLDLVTANSKPDPSTLIMGAYFSSEDFSGIDSLITTNNTSIINGEGNFTISFWFHPDNTPSVIGVNQQIVGHYYKTGTTNYGWYVEWNETDNKISLIVWNNESRDITKINTALSNGITYNIVFTYNSVTNGKGFINGSQDSTNILDEINGTIFNDNMHFYVGDVDYNGKYTNGKLAGINYFGSDLNSSCVNYLMTDSYPYSPYSLHIQDVDLAKIQNAQASCYAFEETNFPYIDYEGNMNLTTGVATTRIKGYTDFGQDFTSSTTYLQGDDRYKAEDLCFTGMFKVNTTSSNQYLFSKFALSDRQYAIRMNANTGILNIFVYDAGSNFESLSSYASLPQNEWFFLGFCYRHSDQEGYMWINNKKRDINILKVMDSGNTPFEIGGYDGGNSEFEGQIDVFRVFDSYLNDTEMFFVYNRTIEGFQCLLTKKIDVTLESPTTNTRGNTQLDVDFNVTGAKLPNNISCDLYVDGDINVSNSSVTENVTTTLSTIGLNDGSHTFYVNCTDTNTTSVSDSLIYIMDTSTPYIDSSTPSVFNTTVFSGFNMNIVGNVTDNNIFRVNRTIYYPNGSVFYNNYSGNLATNTTLYGWDDTFNTTNMPNGNYRMYIESADSHTQKHFKKALFVNKNQNKKQLSFGFADDTINVALVGGNVLGQFESINTTKLNDRYTFELNFKNLITPNSKMVFRVNSEKPIIYLPDSPYPAHMITGNYWLDFAGVEGKITTTKIDKYTYDVQIQTTNKADKFKFHSLGGLNEGNLSIEFQINNCVPSWSCNGYTTCNTSDESSCNSVIDTNSCNLSYSGDYSEFSPQSCDYCTYNLDLNSYGVCNTNISIRQNNYTDLNFATCCNITQNLITDCPFGTVQETGIINESCTSQYQSDYTSSDIQKVAIDGIIKFLIGIVGLTGIIGLVFIFRWVKIKVMKK